ncbi:MAG: hypothetical protein ACOC0Q_07335 [Wenzhouxiangella sp.]
MTEKTVTHLRDYLFDQLERLSDKDLKGEALTEEIERAKVVQATAGRIIETAKAQTDRIRALEGIRLVERDEFLEGEVAKRQIGQGPGNE